MPGTKDMPYRMKNGSFPMDKALEVENIEGSGILNK